MSHKIADNPLGQQTSYPESYAPELLFPVARAANRSHLGISDQSLPFHGFDLWHAYELSWLNSSGKPVVAIGEILVSCRSPNLIESKSLKLYLNSLNQMRIADLSAAQELITQDLAGALGLSPVVRLSGLSNRQEQTALAISAAVGMSLDDLEVETDVFLPDPLLLKISAHEQVEEMLFSDLFKSNCPVTGQPDWGTVVINYRGAQIDHKSLLRYIISYRNHQGFHEHCAEMMFRDITRYCKAEALTLSIHFLRRGGLDINPIRSTSPVDMQMKFPRLIRQ
jgi:7-cyano-7-deazaguanine reductase